VGGAQVAWWGWGGGSQKGRSYVDISGLGCQVIQDWKIAQRAVAALPGVRAKRIDIAADFYHGEVSYEDALEAFHAGKFNRAGPGRPPKMRQILPGSDFEGRTLYVGTRGNDVFLRAYEKGKKEFGELPARDKKGGSFYIPSSGGGDPIRVHGLSKWVRLELELRAAKRPMDLEVVAQRDQYFAGAYPYLQELLPDVKPEILVRPEHVAEADLLKSLENIRVQYGSTLFTAATCYYGDIHRIWKRIVGDRHNDRLVEAGALLLQDKFSDRDEALPVVPSQGRS
jgi:phage replication initiation protein